VLGRYEPFTFNASAIHRPEPSHKTLAVLSLNTMSYIIAGMFNFNSMISSEGLINVSTFISMLSYNIRYREAVPTKILLKQYVFGSTTNFTSNIHTCLFVVSLRTLHGCCRYKFWPRIHCHLVPISRIYYSLHQRKYINMTEVYH